MRLVTMQLRLRLTFTKRVRRQGMASNSYFRRSQINATPSTWQVLPLRSVQLLIKERKNRLKALN